jgi:hypothetical protein
MSAAPETVTDALTLLAADGYDVDVSVTSGGVHWAVCGHNHPGSEVVAERVYRFEGETDPGDEAIVFGVRCPTCGARGSLVSAYGPSADPEVLDHVTMIRQA